MKKLFALFLTTVMCLSLVACGKPNIEECVAKANEALSVHVSSKTEDNYYLYYYQYMKIDNTYLIMMVLNQSLVGVYVNDAVKSGTINKEDSDAFRAKYIRDLDGATESISSDLHSIHLLVDPIFEDTDVTVVTVYVDSEGNFIQYDE